MKKNNNVNFKYIMINSVRSVNIKTLIMCFALLMTIPSFAQITEANYKIYSIRLNKEVNLNDIVKDMKNYNVLFF